MYFCVAPVDDVTCFYIVLSWVDVVEFSLSACWCSFRCWLKGLPFYPVYCMFEGRKEHYP